MRKQLQVIYKDMPIDKAEVRELNKKGFKVVDAKFKPDGYECPLTPKAAPKRTQKPKKAD